MYYKRTEEEIVNSALETLSSSTNITQLSPGATARTLLEIVSREQGRQHDTFNNNLLQSFIRFCDDRFLDLFGDMLNLPRLPSQKSESNDQNFMFYVDSGTFGDINGGSDIVVPSGTEVSTVPYDGEIITPGIEEQPTITYYTASDATLPSASSFYYVPVRARFEGASSNIPRNVLTRHTFSSYTLSNDELLKCTNKFAISSGQDRESPQSYRYRLGNIFKARQMAIMASVRLAALSVPGVTYIKDVNSEQGPGSYSVYVQSSTPTTSPGLIEKVAAASKTVTAAGIKSYILAPEPLGVEFVANVTFVSRATRENISQAYVDMRNAVEEYIGGLNIGDTLEINTLIDIMLYSTPYVASIGDETPNTFTEVYIYRRTPVGSIPERSLFLGTSIEPLYNERIILETDNRHRGIKFIAG